MPHRRVLASLSIFVHAIVFGAVVVAQLLATGPLPTPHRPRLFEQTRIVHLVEIALPAAPSSRRRAVRAGDLLAGQRRADRRADGHRAGNRP